MTLHAGSHLGPYEIVAPLGIGGHRLVTRTDQVRSLRARLPVETGEREFPWLGTIGATGNLLSADGKLLLFSDESKAAGPTYSLACDDSIRGRSSALGTGDAVAIGRRSLSSTRRCRMQRSTQEPGQARNFITLGELRTPHHPLFHHAAVSSFTMQR